MSSAAASHVSGLPADQVHERLQHALEEFKDAERNAVLWFAEIHSRKLFRDLGFSSIHQYAQEALGFSKGRTFQFIRLAEKFQELPELRRSVAEGSVSWTKARVVASVATPATESQWVEDAKTKGRREIERQAEAARARGRAARRRDTAQSSLLDDAPAEGQDAPDDQEKPAPEVPVDVVMHMRPEQFARFEALLHAARERGEPGDRVELVLSALEALVTVPASNAQSIENDGVTRGTNAESSRSPFQVHVMLCPECGKGEAPTNRGPIPLSLAELAALACDANVESGGKNRAVIPPRLRRQVLARDRFTCRGAGCGRTRFLTVHHIVRRENGGKNVPENLLALCGGCHRTLHDVADRMQWSATGAPQMQ